MLQRADLVVADLTITYDREQAVDFTMPFMNLGKCFTSNPLYTGKRKQRSVNGAHMVATRAQILGVLKCLKIKLNGISQ
jgi:hypothetical protein